MPGARDDPAITCQFAPSKNSSSQAVATMSPMWMGERSTQTTGFGALPLSENVVPPLTDATPGLN